MPRAAPETGLGLGGPGGYGRKTAPGL